MSLCLADGDVVDDIRALQPFAERGSQLFFSLRFLLYLYFFFFLSFSFISGWPEKRSSTGRMLLARTNGAWRAHHPCNTTHLRSARPAIALKSINLLFSPGSGNVIKSIYALHLLSFFASPLEWGSGEWLEPPTFWVVACWLVRLRVPGPRVLAARTSAIYNNFWFLFCAFPILYFCCQFLQSTLA